MAIQGQISISCRSVARKLNIDRNFAAKLIKEIQEEQAQKINEFSVDEELVKMWNVQEAVERCLLQMINDEKASNNQKAKAIRQLSDTTARCVDMTLKYKFDIDVPKERRKLYKKLNKI